MATIGFKKVIDYVPKSHEITLNETFRKERDNNSKRYREIGKFATGVSYYKYFPIATAIKCLENGTIAFVEPSRWNDAYESLYYEADYSLIAPAYKDHPRVFATCVTNQKYDEPAWRIYSGEEKICVLFELDRFKFRYALLKAIGANDTIYEGEVQYASKKIIDTIGKKKLVDIKTGMDRDNELYSEFIAYRGLPFCIDNYMNLLLLKRKDFKHEQETRFFIVRNQDIVNIADKAKESSIEVSDATKREIVMHRGEVLVLKDLEWIDFLKSITINAEKDSLPYRQLKMVIDQLIDKSKVIDPVKKDDYKKRLKPIPYLVYGTSPRVITIEK